MSDICITTSGSEAVTCDALHLALIVTQLLVAWHAGVTSADKAMDLLNQALAEIRNPPDTHIHTEKRSLRTSPAEEPWSSVPTAVRATLA